MISSFPLSRASLALASTALWLTATPPLGWAAPQATPTEGAEATAASTMDAAEAFGRGRTLWEAGDHVVAYPFFQRALEVTGSPNARIYVARRLRELGRLPEAYAEMPTTWRDAMAMAKTEDRYVATRDAAGAELVMLERQIGKVIVVLPPALSGAAVSINGVALPADRLSHPQVVPPGPVRIQATAAAGSAVQHEVVVAAGAIQTVTLPAPTASAPPPAASADPPAEDADDGASFGPMHIAGIAVGAVGVAGLVTFAIGRVQADEEIATLETDCGEGPCTDPSYGDVIDRGQQAETMAAIGLGVGIAGVLAGAGLLLFGGSGEDDGEAAWSVTHRGLRLRF